MGFKNKLHDMHIKRVNELNENVLKDVKDAFFPKHNKFGKKILLSIQHKRYELIEQDIYPTDPKDVSISLFDDSTGSCEFKIFTERHGPSDIVKENERIIKISKMQSTMRSPGLSIRVLSDTSDKSLVLDMSQGMIKRILNRIKTDINPNSKVRTKEQENDDEIESRFKGFPNSNEPSFGGMPPFGPK